ncbi:hypothetical protein CCACVL1_21896 [Corchorus capsularis]|uniref:Uncharacterized protein n=1 Tax=Corchorus capsularis TaxID=210143 RepID=A0A1R3H1P8_COCAP|nr:hypothetical protein CCACVL1_21896 [Corchorus capsularis]
MSRIVVAELLLPATARRRKMSTRKNSIGSRYSSVPAAQFRPKSRHHRVH